MTYFKKIAAASALALVFAGGTAFADGHNEKTKSKTMTDASQSMSVDMKERKQLKKMVKSKMTADEKAYWATLSKAEQTEWMDTAIETQKRKMIADNMMDVKADTNMSATTSTASETSSDMKMSSETKMMKKDKMSDERDMMKSKSMMNTTSSISCPAGTTAQPDMTCLVTGDYNPNS